MTLETYTLLSLSIAATLFSLVLCAALIAGILSIRRLRRLFDRLDRIANAGSETATVVKEFIHTSAERLLALERLFLTLDGLRDLGGALAKSLRPNRKRSITKKGVSHADTEEIEE